LADPATLSYDLVFMGNASIDEVYPFGGPVQPLFGGGVMLCAMAAAWSGKRIAVVTRIAECDAHRLEPLRKAGIDVHVIFTPETTRHRAFHLSEDVDQRQIVLLASAGPFSIEELPSMRPTFLHLAGLTDQEFSLGFMKDVKERGFSFSVDMQGLVRQADRRTGEVSHGDVLEKEEIAGLADKIKLDAVEATFLVGTDDLERAAVRIEEWGCGEVMVTRSDGVLVRQGGRTYFEPFSNRSLVGRTGRGDTTFGCYLARRLDHEVADSLKFAAAAASIKLESPGPFEGTVEQVLARMEGSLG
jgi:sugar/nucleoside kinase (ribokinase family)